jgi:hypothetical protein
MKNIQIIDDGVNATFSIFQTSDEAFLDIFPGLGQDIEIIEDYLSRADEKRANEILSNLWTRPVRKQDACGIHGTLYYGWEARRQFLPVSKRECDRDPSDINQAQRELYKPDQDYYGSLRR